MTGNAHVEVQRPAGFATHEVTIEVADTFKESIKAELAALLDAGMLTAAQVKFERSYLANNGLYAFYGAQFYVGLLDGRPVAMHAIKWNSSPRKNAWGRYCNHYVAYTRPTLRREGIGTALAADLMAYGASRNYDRLKTLCQSWAGFGYHERLRDHIWGTNDKGELSIDSPLHAGPWPEGIPIKARPTATNEDGPLSEAQLIAILTDPAGRFRRTEDEVRAVLAKREWRRAVDWRSTAQPVTPLDPP